MILQRRFMEKPHKSIISQRKVSLRLTAAPLSPYRYRFSPHAPPLTPKMILLMIDL